MTSATPTSYHHGDLPHVVLRNAAELIGERGVAGFSLREVARRAGVSHTAPGHHFGDAEGLLTALAVEAFEHLESSTSAAVAAADNPVDGLVALGAAYVRVAVDHPGHCAVVFRSDVVDADDPAYQLAGDRAYSVLLGAIERLAEAHNPDLDTTAAARLCWASMQGLVDLYPSMQRLAEKDGSEIASVDDLARQFARQTIAGLAPDA